MHAHDQPEVVVGAGTLAAEIEDDAGLPDRVLVSVGGGGLIGGVAAWFASRCRVEALEPVGSPTLHAARAAGEPVDVAVGGLAADALGARGIGAIAWPWSPPLRCRWRRCAAAPCSRPRTNAWCWCCAAPTSMRRCCLDHAAGQRHIDQRAQGAVAGGRAVRAGRSAALGPRLARSPVAGLPGAQPQRAGAGAA